MQRSYLGYDPIIGARYYGIGNEFAGVYLISALMLLHPLFSGKRKMLTTIIFMVIFFFLVFILGKNTLGTNAGATLSVGITFAFLLYRLNSLRWSWYKMGLLFGMILGGVFLLLYILQLKGEQTHIGYAFSRLWSGDFVYIFEIIKTEACNEFEPIPTFKLDTIIGY